MIFEEALRSELIQIPKLALKVFPLVAPKETKAPFLVYKKESVKFRKSLSGQSNKAEGVYELHLLNDDYVELQQLSEEIKEKLLSFYARNIGTGGPYIENVTVEYTGDGFEYEPNILRSSIKLVINY